MASAAWKSSGSRAVILQHHRDTSGRQRQRQRDRETDREKQIPKSYEV